MLFRSATQLGMTRFTPLHCERSVVKPATGARERWRRICLEACKQSRRFYLPVIDPSAPPREVAARAVMEKNQVWIAHPAAAAISVTQAVTRSAARDVTILVGPEGGFTEAEVQQTSAGGAGALTLGAAILRIETAALAALAAFSLTAGAGAR